MRPSPGAAVSERCGGDCAARKRSQSGRLEHVQCAPETHQALDRGVLARRGKRLEGARAARSLLGKRPRYFTQIATAAFRSGRLLMLGLDYDGEPIARRCAFLAGDGRSPSRPVRRAIGHYSPGTILEIDSLLQLQGLGGCAGWIPAPPPTMPSSTASPRPQGDS